MPLRHFLSVYRVDKLLDAVYRLVLDQHTEKVKALAQRVRDTDENQMSALNGFFGTQAANQALASVFAEWQRLGCSREELAGILVGTSYGYSTEKSNEVVELVWTGPDLNLTPVRRSEQVLLEIIDSARESLFLVSFVLVNIPSVEEAIRHAIDRGVDVRMLLESEDKGKDGSKSFRKTIKRLNTEIPGLTLYVWPREKREGIEGGFARVHAKGAVADKFRAFLTSANLTSAALDKNIEMGVRVQGGAVPSTIYQQFIGMIRAKEIVPYSANRFKTEAKPAATKLDQLVDDLEGGTELLLSFKNDNLNLEEIRRFKVLSLGDEKPKANTVVLVRENEQWLVGKYVWSKQQDTEGGRIFYLVQVRGFGPTRKFEIDENDWDTFMPKAMEING